MLRAPRRSTAPPVDPRDDDGGDSEGVAVNNRGAAVASTAIEMDDRTDNKHSADGDEATEAPAESAARREELRRYREFTAKQQRAQSPLTGNSNSGGADGGLSSTRKNSQSATSASTQRSTAAPPAAAKFAPPPGTVSAGSGAMTPYHNSFTHPPPQSQQPNSAPAGAGAGSGEPIAQHVPVSGPGMPLTFVTSGELPHVAPAPVPAPLSSNPGVMPDPNVMVGTSYDPNNTTAYGGYPSQQQQTPSGMPGMQPPWYLPAPTAPPLSASQPVAWWLFLVLIIALFLTSSLIYVNKIGYYNDNVDYTYMWMQISLTCDFVGVSLLIFVLAGWMMRCCQIYARMTIHFLWHALIFLLAGFCFDVQRYSVYTDQLNNEGYTIQAIGLACLYAVCVWTTTVSLKSQHQISPVANLLERELEMTARLLQEKERSLEREQATARALKDDLDSAIRTKNQLVAAKDKQLNDLQNELEQTKLRLFEYQRDNESLLDANGKSFIRGSKAKFDSIEVHKLTAFELRESNLQLSSQLAGLAADISAQRKRAADAEDARARTELALRATRGEADAAVRAKAAIETELTRTTKLVLELEAKLKSYGTTSAAGNCLNCVEWEKKYTHISRSAIGASKISEERDLLLAERDRLKALVAKLQKKLLDHEQILTQRLGQMKGEINSFSRFATSVKDTTLTKDPASS